MNRREVTLLVVVAILSAAGTVAVSHAVDSGQGATTQSSTADSASGIARWLQMSSDGAAALAPVEAAYQADRTRLERALASEREALAKLLEDPAASDAQLRAQVARVIASDGAYEQRTAEFLIAVRPLLTPAQQRKLCDRFAAGVREAGGYRWRHGQSANSEGRRGGGPPPGRGPSQGRGRGHSDESTRPVTQPGRP